MKSRLLPLCCSFLAVACVLAAPVRADDEYISNSADADVRYRVSEGSLPAYGIARPSPAYAPPGAAVTLRRRAENVALAVSLVNDGRQAEPRNRELLETLQRMVERAESTPGLRIHNGRIGLSTRDRKLVSWGSSDTRTSIDIFVLAVLPEDRGALEVVNTIKQFLAGVQGVGQTRIVEGSVGLSLREPERFRPELVEAIVADVHFVTQKLGGKVRVSISGLDRPLTVRQRNDTELELAIGYSYTIEYARE